MALMGPLLQKGRNDAVDRLNYRWTSVMLVVMCALIVGKSHLGRPIECSPLIFESTLRTADGFEKFAQNYCLLGHMYRAYPNEQLPLTAETRAERGVYLHEWMPFILLAQVCLLIAPKLLWKLYGDAINAHDPVTILIDCALTKATKGKSSSMYQRVAGLWTGNVGMQGKYKGQYRLPSSDYLAALRTKALDNAKTPTTRCRLTGFYLAFKVLQLVNSLFQLVALNAFLSSRNTFWGYDVLKGMVTGEAWPYSEKFPAVANCDVDLFGPRPGFGSHNFARQYPFQCVLPISLLIEKCLFVVWWWLFGISLINFNSLCKWLSISVDDFIAHQLAYRTTDSKGEIDKCRLRSFVDDYLGLDGVTTLRLVHANLTDPSVTPDIIDKLWRSYNEDGAEKGPDGEENDAQLEEGVIHRGRGTYGGKTNKGTSKKHGVTANGVHYGGQNDARLPV